MCIYLPTKAVLFQLMRACLGVYKVEDLWFNQGVEQLEEDDRLRKLEVAQIMIDHDLDQKDIKPDYD